MLQGCPIYFLVKGRNILFSRSQGHSLYIWTATGLDLFAPIPARLPGLNYHDCHLTNVMKYLAKHLQVSFQNDE